MSKNPCQLIADFYKDHTESEQLLSGLFGGRDYHSMVRSNGTEYQITCYNSMFSLKTTNIRVQHRLTGDGFVNSLNVSTEFDPKSGKLIMRNVIGNVSNVVLPYPDGKQKV